MRMDGVVGEPSGSVTIYTQSINIPPYLQCLQTLEWRLISTPYRVQYNNPAIHLSLCENMIFNEWLRCEYLRLCARFVHIKTTKGESGIGSSSMNWYEKEDRGVWRGGGSCFQFVCPRDENTQ